MRINLPVTQNAYLFPADQTLISITDLKGRITYCNANFIAVSGYSQNELLGQPHNLIRHPDMPAEAYRDMWSTVQAGLPWTALVKNRRKNGDYYWVRANATPMRNGGRIVGYLSVRTHVPDEDIAAAEKLYAVMRREAEDGRLVHVLRRGELITNTLFGRIRRALAIGPRGKLYLATLAAVGAAPRTRRSVAAAYTFVVAFVGSVLGMVVGFVPGLAITWPLTVEGYPANHGPYIDVPWLMIAVVVVGLPLLTAAIVGACTRSRLPMVSRLT